MSVLLEVVVPVFALIGLGYLAAMRRWIDDAGFRGLNTFVFAFASPALLFAGGTSGHGAGGGAALAFLIGALSVYAGALWLGRSALRLPLGEAGMFALNCCFGNTVMLGIPVIAAAYGQEGVAVILAIIAAHSMVLLSVATVVAEIGLHASAPLGRVVRATLSGVVRNPIVMSVVAAIVWSQLGLGVPGPVRRTLELIGASAPPAALVCLGASLVGFDARGAWRETSWTLALKLAVLPALVWLLAQALGLSRLETAVAVVVSGLPTGANAFMLARRYALGADRSGAAVLIATTLSVGTLSVLLWAFRLE